MNKVLFAFSVWIAKWLNVGLVFAVLLSVVLALAGQFTIWEG